MYYNQSNIQIYLGNALEVLKELPVNSVQCCITSPPYWNLRDYSTEPQIWDGDPNCDHEWVVHHQNPKGGKNLPDNMPAVGANRYLQTTSLRNQGINTGFCSKCGAWKGSLGNEPTIEMYVGHLVLIFQGVKRVLRKDGVLWLNIGDSYAGSGGTSGQKPNHLNFGKSKVQRFYATARNGHVPDGLKPKDLCGIPWHVAFALQKDGWWLRSDIIWEKPNAVPESVIDRPTKSHEYIFLLTKSRKYYYNTNAIREPHKAESLVRIKGKWDGQRDVGRIKSSLSNMNIAKMCHPNGRNKRSVWAINTQSYKGAHFAVFPPEIPRICILAGSDPGDIILDPFAGAMTTLLAAKQLNRQAVGIELNESYIKTGIKRLEQEYLQFKES